MMKLYYLCCEHGLYEEAKKIALKTCEMDPTNVVAQSAVRVAHLLCTRKTAENVKHSPGQPCPQKGTPTACLNADCEKKQQISQLLEQFRSCYQKGNYKEAVWCAAQALELDPANTEAAMGAEMARIRERLREYDSIPRDYPLDGDLMATEKDNPMKNSPEAGMQVQSRLGATISLNFSGVELAKVINDLRDITGLNIVVDKAALDKAGISLKQPVTMRMENCSVKAALALLLQKCNLTYLVTDEAVVLTTKPAGPAEPGASNRGAEPMSRGENQKMPTQPMGAMIRLCCGSLAFMPWDGISTPGTVACVPCFQLINSLEQVFETAGSGQERKIFRQ
jgi:hypothetical protein